MYRIAVIGDPDSVLGFKALGLEVCPAEDVEQARQAIHRMAKENYAILYLTEQLAAQLQSEIARYQDALTPAIILIPGKEGSLGIGMGRSAWRNRHPRPCPGNGRRKNPRPQRPARRRAWHARRRSAGLCPHIRRRRPRRRSCRAT